VLAVSFMVIWFSGLPCCSYCVLESTRLAHHIAPCVGYFLWGITLPAIIGCAARKGICSSGGLDRLGRFLGYPRRTPSQILAALVPKVLRATRHLRCWMNQTDRSGFTLWTGESKSRIMPEYSWLAGEGSSIPHGGTTANAVRVVARRYGVSYGNQVDQLVAAISGSTARTSRTRAAGESAVRR
jgi:hypothetical protein